MGRGTSGGGNDGPNVVVTNQQLLVLPRCGFNSLTDEEQHAVTLVELRFARDVAASAAAAYEEILGLVESRGSGPNTDGFPPQ